MRLSPPSGSPRSSIILCALQVQTKKRQCSIWLSSDSPHRPRSEPIWPSNRDCSALVTITARIEPRAWPTAWRRKPQDPGVHDSLPPTRIFSICAATKVLPSFRCPTVQGGRGRLDTRGWVAQVTAPVTGERSLRPLAIHFELGPELSSAPVGPNWCGSTGSRGHRSERSPPPAPTWPVRLSSRGTRKRANGGWLVRALLFANSKRSQVRLDRHLCAMPHLDMAAW